MNFNYHLPTKVFFGEDSVKKNASALALGERAYIVTGKTSGKASGAVGDVTTALRDLKIPYEIFEGIQNNPDVEQCRSIGGLARGFKADFIIGIGGGSPLDASKAVAVFAANDIPAQEVFNYGYKNGVLPIAAIPTTSGTGSEVTQYSVMTWHKIRSKRSFGGELTFPRVALLDPKYTDSLSLNSTRYTAMDAFTHCFESMISIKASPFTDADNMYALNLFGQCMGALESGEVSGLRESLMLISLIGGSTIAQTGTTLMHAMGYPLTYFYDIPHGLANAMVKPAYMRVVEKFRPARLEAALSSLGFKYGDVIDYLNRNYPVTIAPCADELRLWSEQTLQQASVKNTGLQLDADEMYQIFKSIF